jgi:hypothetical protein
MNSANVQTAHQLSPNDASSTFIPVQASLVSNGLSNSLNQASTQSITTLLNSNKSNTINKTILQPTNPSAVSEPSTPINNLSSSSNIIPQSPANSLNASNFGGFGNKMQFESFFSRLNQNYYNLLFS